MRLSACLLYANLLYFETSAKVGFVFNMFTCSLKTVVVSRVSFPMIYWPIKQTQIQFLNIFSTNLN